MKANEIILGFTYNWNLLRLISRDKNIIFAVAAYHINSANCKYFSLCNSGHHQSYPSWLCWKQRSLCENESVWNCRLPTLLSLSRLIIMLFILVPIRCLSVFKNFQNVLKQLTNGGFTFWTSASLCRSTALANAINMSVRTVVPMTFAEVHRFDNLFSLIFRDTKTGNIFGYLHETQSTEFCCLLFALSFNLGTRKSQQLNFRDVSAGN